jgi:hypothetical protein
MTSTEYEDSEYLETSSLDSEHFKFFCNGPELNTVESLARRKVLAERKDQVVSLLNQSCGDEEDSGYNGGDS